MSFNFKEVGPEELKDNPFDLIGTDWTLITAGEESAFNTMTASWGGLGILWHKKVCFCFVRPTRYTYEFMEKYNSFTLSFFEEKYREILKICGTRSGRDIDKIKETGLVPIKSSFDSVYFKQSRLALDCKKIYHQDIDPSNFLDPSIDKNYPSKDYHRMYVGEISGCLVRDI